MVFRLQSRVDSLEIELQTRGSTQQTLARAAAALDLDGLRDDFGK